MDRIIEGGLLDVQCSQGCASACIICWSSGAAEQIEAIQTEFAQKAVEKADSFKLDELERLQKLYNELLYEVARKYEGETRHQTALRYIRERETDTGSDPSQAA